MARVYSGKNDVVTADKYFKIALKIAMDSKTSAEIQKEMAEAGPKGGGKRRVEGVVEVVKRVG